jgi:hypothetical protein
MWGKGAGAKMAVLVVALGFAFGVTGPKLYMMALIKGWISGAVVTNEVITQKGVEPPNLLGGEANYWVSWVKGEVRDSWSSRERVPPEVWEGIREGDPIEVVHIAGSPYLRIGVFVEPGNFVFDCVLLVAEVTVALVMLVLLLIWRRQSKVSISDF